MYIILLMTFQYFFLCISIIVVYGFDFIHKNILPLNVLQLIEMKGHKKNVTPTFKIG